MKKSKTTPAEFPPESRQRAPERDGKRKMKNNLPGIPPKHCLAASQGEKFRKQPRRNSASNFDFRHHRHVVGGAFPAAHGLQDGVAPDRAPEAGADPDVIEPAALVRRLPILRPIAPPRIDLLVRRHEFARHVDPVESGLGCVSRSTSAGVWLTT